MLDAFVERLYNVIAIGFSCSFLLLYLHLSNNQEAVYDEL